MIVGLTVAVMAPMNVAIEGWAAAGVPDDMPAVRIRWSLLQGIRAALCVAAFAAMVAALRLSTRRD